MTHSTPSAQKPNPKIWQFEAIGTKWRIDAAADAAQMQVLKQRVHDRIEAFDQAYSRFRNDSLVHSMSLAAGTYTLPQDAQPLFALYEQLYGLTGGLVTPLIGQTLADAGYDADYRFTERPMASPPRWEDVLHWDGDRQLSLDEPALLDFGAAGKGYLIDLLTDCMQQMKITEYCIDGSGDLRHVGSDPMLIGLEDPRDEGLVIGTVTLQNASLCASSGARRAWQGRHHIMNPQTLSSPDAVIATWVITSEARIADGLATALFFVEPEILQRSFAFAYIILYSDGRVRTSQHDGIHIYSGGEVA